MAFCQYLCRSCVKLLQFITVTIFSLLNIVDQLSLGIVDNAHIGKSKTQIVCVCCCMNIVGRILQVVLWFCVRQTVCGEVIFAWGAGVKWLAKNNDPHYVCVCVYAALEWASSSTVLGEQHIETGMCTAHSLILVW